MKKITFYLLHLGIGGVEKSVVDQANLLSEKYEVDLVVAYRVSDKIAYNISDKVKVKMLCNTYPDKAMFMKKIKKLKLIACAGMGFKALFALRSKNILMKKAMNKSTSDINISTRIHFSKMVTKKMASKSFFVAEEHAHHNNNKAYIKSLFNSCKNIHYLLPVSKQLTKDYEEIFKNTNTKIVYIQHFLDFYPNKISTLDTTQIVAIGRFAKEKGFFDLLLIFSRLVGRNPGLTLNIVGDGPEKDDLIQYAKDLRLQNNVVFHGYKSRDEIPELLRNPALYFMTSYEESFGLVLVEAASFGIPQIAFDSAQGASEIISNGKSGYLIPDRNIEKYVCKAYDLLNDKETLQEFSDNARDLSKNYKINVVRDKWFEFIDGLEK